MTRHHKKIANKRTRKYKKYVGGADAQVNANLSNVNSAKGTEQINVPSKPNDGIDSGTEQINNQTVESSVGVLGTAKDVASSALGTAVDVGNTAVGLVTDKAKDIAEKTTAVVADKAMDTLETGIKLLNNPELEQQAEHAIQESGHLAAELVKATQEPIREGILGSVDTAKEAAQQVASSSLNIATNTLKAVPGVGAAVVVVDDVGQLALMGNSLLKLFSKFVGTFTNASNKALDVVNKTMDKSNNSMQPNNVLRGGTSQLGGIIDDRNRTFNRIENSLNDFQQSHRNTKKHNKQKRSKTRKVY